jgi:hypothetical protein
MPPPGTQDVGGLEIRAEASIFGGWVAGCRSGVPDSARETMSSKSREVREAVSASANCIQALPT